MPKKQTQKETKQKRPAFSREKIEPKDVRELLPLDQRYFNYAKREIVDSASSHGFLFAEPQLSAPSSFFYKLNKKEEDAFRKRLVSFPARVKTDEVCLRPEVLPLVIKSYLSNKSRFNYEMVKFFYLGPVFKKSKDKEVYLEEETKFGFEALGTEETTVVAELIALAYNLYSKFEFKPALRINNLGCSECQPIYWQQLEDYYKNRKRYMCEACKKFYISKSLKFLSCTNANCQELALDAPQLVDYLCEECREEFVNVLEFLDETEIPYVLDSKMVLQPNYYNKVVFSIDIVGIKKDETENLIIGGRHDKYLASAFGEKQVSAVGFEGSLGDIVAVMKRNNFSLPEKSGADVFVAQLGEGAKKKALKLFEDLREENIKVAHALDQDSLNQQIGIADKLKVRVILILGQREILDNTVLLRDTETGAQEIIRQDKIFDELHKRLSRNATNNHFVEIDQSKKEEDIIEEDLKNLDGELN